MLKLCFGIVIKRGRIAMNSNPNGSLQNIAGIRNAAGNVLGLMPHPERSAETLLNNEDGKLIFLSLLHAIGQPSTMT